MSNFIDHKVTIWQRLHIPENVPLEEIKEMVEKKKHINEIFDFIMQKYGGEPTNEILYDTEEFIQPDDVGGLSTMELYTDDNDISEEAFIISNSEIRNKDEEIRKSNPYYFPGARKTFVDPDEYYDTKRENQ